MHEEERKRIRQNKKGERKSKEKGKKRDNGILEFSKWKGSRQNFKTLRAPMKFYKLINVEEMNEMDSRQLTQDQREE